ncbi:hypothetical protein AHAS_Ahas19G0236100 [Arachis hypogaea]
MLQRGFICMWWLWLTITIRVITHIGLVCIRIRIIPIRVRRGLLPRRLSISLWLLPSLISKFLMHILIEAFIPYNIV